MARPILIVDDDSFVGQTLQDLLLFHESAGDVLLATNGARGLSLAMKNSPAAIFVDYNMPVMDGLSFVRELRNAPQLTDVPLVMMTADDRQSANLDEMRSHCKGILRKPFTFEEVCNVLDTVLTTATA